MVSSFRSFARHVRTMIIIAACQIDRNTECTGDRYVLYRNRDRSKHARCNREWRNMHTKIFNVTGNIRKIQWLQKVFACRELCVLVNFHISRYIYNIKLSIVEFVVAFIYHSIAWLLSVRLVILLLSYDCKNLILERWNIEHKRYWEQVLYVFSFRFCMKCEKLHWLNGYKMFVYMVKRYYVERITSRHRKDFNSYWNVWKKDNCRGLWLTSQLNVLKKS